MVQAATGNPLQLIAAERLSELGRDTREELTKLPDVVLVPHGRWHAEQIAVLLLEQIEVEAIRVTLGVASVAHFLSLSTALRASVIPIINLLQDAAGEVVINGRPRPEHWPFLKQLHTRCTVPSAQISNCYRAHEF